MPKKKSTHARNKKKFSDPLLFSKFLFVFGTLIILLSFLFKSHQAVMSTFAAPEVFTITNETTSHSHTIAIEKISLKLPIIETDITENVWDISNEGASHLIRSATPGEKGNIVIYAHNTLDRFGNLSELTINDQIIIRNKKGETFTYRVATTSIVEPHQVEILLPTETETLTLYTCYGFADLKRFVVKAKRIY